MGPYDLKGMLSHGSCHLMGHVVLLGMSSHADMEKGVDTRTLSAEIFENCGNFWIMED